MCSDDELRRALARAAAEGLFPQTDLELDAPPLEISPDLRRRTLQRVNDRSSELLGTRLREAVEEAGWTIDDWVAEAGSMGSDVRALIAGKGNPECIPPRLLARLLAKLRFDPRDIVDLIRQAVASNAVFPSVVEGHVYGRTSGLCCKDRETALASGGFVRDPDRGARSGEVFVEEVIDHWLRLARSED